MFQNPHTNNIFNIWQNQNPRIWW